MGDARYQIHWTPAIGKIDPRDLTIQRAIIENAEYVQGHENPEEEGLNLTLRAKERDLVKKVLLKTTSHPFGLTDDELRLSTKKAVDAVYNSFQIRLPEELIGKEVVAMFLRNEVIGVGRDY